LHGHVEHEEILKTLLTNQSATKKVESLIKQANAAGGFDNVTIVYVCNILGESS
jgi:serine/threonine protein phosphatase PrpC